MSGRIWTTSDEGVIEYVSLTRDLLPGALQVIKDSFYPYETVCIACGLADDPEGQHELEDLSADTALDGVSVVARDVSNGRVVGVAFNKLQVKTSEGSSYFEDYAKKCKKSSSRDLIKFMIQADSICDVFELCKIDCLLELMFLAVSPDYFRRGIGTKLGEATVEVAKELYKGKNVKVPISNAPLGFEHRPKAVAAIFTSNKSQGVGRKLKWNIAATETYDKFYHDGVPFSKILGESQKKCTVEYLQL